MKFRSFKTMIFGLLAVYVLTIVGCGSGGGSSSSSSSSGGTSSSSSSGGTSSSSSSGGVDVTAPVIASDANVTVFEHTPLNYTVVATDESTITYSIFNPSQGSLFSIDQTTGVLSFTAPTFDVANDQFGVTVRVEDLSGNFVDQDITVTVVDAGAVTNRAIMPLIPISFTQRNKANNTVTNTLTGFVWEDQEANEDNVTFEAAKAYCINLKTTNFAGINNWRLPSRADLFKIARYTPDPEHSSYVADGFFHKQGAPYWTREEINGTNKAWTVTFGGVGDLKVAKDFENDENNVTAAYVRCVSGFHRPPIFSGFDTDPTRADVDTGLTWHTHRFENNGDYQDGNFTVAEATCVRYGDGYRLPNINELRSIIEYDARIVTDIKGPDDTNVSAIIVGSVFGDFTITEADGDVYDVKTLEGGFDTIVWSSTRTQEDKVRTLYISPLEISDTNIDDNLTFAPGTSIPIRTVCVKRSFN